MSGCLRSLKLCSIRREVRAGVEGWLKTRLSRAAWLVPPGNAFLRVMGVCYRVCGRDWARYETTTFRRAHPQFAEPVILSARQIWLPDLPGRVVAELGLAESGPGRWAEVRAAAFAELGRLHRLGLMHGDPHRGNFLHDEPTGRCHILDFETYVPMANDLVSAFDAALLVLDFRRDAAGASGEAWREWLEAMGNPEIAALTIRLLERPGWRLRRYWRLLGYQLPESPER
jgi:hypothetical protein